MNIVIGALLVGACLWTLLVFYGSSFADRTVHFWNDLAVPIIKGWLVLAFIYVLVLIGAHLSGALGEVMQ